MKKITLLIAFLLSVVMAGYGQVNAYTRTVLSGQTYTQITGGTVINTNAGLTASSMSGNQDDGSVLVTLPFTFTYDNVAYTQATFCTNGWVGMGDLTSVSSSNGRGAGNLFTTTNPSKTLAAWFGDGGANFPAPDGVGSMVHGPVGTGAYAFEWRSAVGVDYNLTTVNLINYMVVIYGPTSATPGRIEFLYGTTAGATPTTGRSIGIENATGGSGNFQNALDGSSTSTATASAWPGNGNGYRFDPPPPCNGAPVGGTIAGDAVRTICTGVAPAALTVTGSTLGVPGITYQWEQSTDAGANWANAVGGTGTTTASYTPPAFAGASIQYRLKITCTNTSQSGNSSVVTFNNQTAPATQVTAATAAPATVYNSSFSLTWTNGNGGRRLVIISPVAIVDPVNVTGQAAANVANATYAGTGQQIVYDGTGTSVTIYGLACNTAYNVKVYEYNRCGSAPYDYYYNTTTGTNAITVTTGQPATMPLPVTNNLTGFTGDNLSTVFPGWSEGTITTSSGSTPGTSFPVAPSSGWANTSVLGITTARVNLYTNTKNEWIISPKMAITANSRLKFKAAITDFVSGSADATRMVGTDDKVRVMVSVDGCGAVWTPVYTFNASTTATLTNVLTDYTVNLNAYVGQTIQIAFQATDGPLDDSPDYDFHIGAFVIEQTPVCDVPVVATATNVTKNSATISWTAPTVGTPTGYQYVVSTTSTAPVGAGTAATGTTANVTGLTSSTVYYVYVRTVCGSDFSDWSIVSSFMTMCAYPDFTSTTGAAICGQGTATLQAAAAAGSVYKWYTAETGGNAIATGASYTTPVISATTNYYVSAGLPVANTNVVIGAGASTSGGLGSSPYYHGWGGVKTQYIFTAAELENAGVVAGPINSLGFTITSLGTPTFNNFAISVGTTTQAVATDTHITGLTPVYSNAAQPLTMGLNNYVFTTPFVWNGTSNIVIQVCYSNVNTGGSSSAVQYDTNSFVSTTYTYADNQSASDICSATTGSVNDSGGTATTTNRAKVTFNATAICLSPRVAVAATVSQAVPVTAAASATSICAGVSTNLSVTSANAGYTYTWMPGNLTGAAQTVTPTTTTTYTVTATETQAGVTCTAVSTVTVTVNALPTPIVTNANVTVCEGSTQLLTSTGGVATTTIYQEGFDTAAAGFTTTAEEGTVSLTPNSTYYAQGTGSVLFNTGNGGDVNYAMNTNLSLVGYTSAVLTFSHIAALEGYSTTYDAGYVEYSTDGGATWTTFSASDYYSTGTLVTNQDPADGVIFSTKSYPEWITNFDEATDTPGTGPATALWRNEEIHIPSTALGSSQFRVRFRITSDGSVSYYGWLLDNLKITGSAVQTIWSPVTNLYTNAAATIPYTGTPRTNVYTRPTASITYTATAANPVTSCSVSATVNVTMNSTASPTAAAAQNFCSSGTVASLVATGTNIQWYAAATGGTALAATTALVNGTTYYATQTVNGCQSFVRTPVAVTITTVSVDDPADVTACNSYVLPALTNGAYYTGPGGTGTTHAAGDIITTTTTLYVYASGGTNPVCTAENSFVITVNVTPVPTATAGQNFCNSATVADLTATGTGIQWYTAATGGTALATDTTLVTGTTYYASQTIGTCESATRVAVVVTVTTVEADAPADVAVCNSYTLPALTSGNYFTGPAGTGTARAAGDVIISTTTLYVYAVGSPNPLCTDENSFTITINSAATPDGAAVQNICNSGTLADLDVTGDNIQWYADATGGTALASTTALVNGSTYYATQTVGVCESVIRKAVVVSITTVEADAPANVTACNSYTLPALLNGNYFTGADGTGEALEPGDILTATTTVYVYSAVGINPVCTAQNSFVVTINTVETPSGDAIQTVTVNDVSEATIEDLQASGTGSISWYASEQDAIAGTNPLPTGTVVISGNTYYASQMMGECMSPTALAVTVDVVLGDKNFDIRSFSYYPNPVVNILNLTYSSEITSVTVFNLLGQQVMEKQPNATEVKLDMSGLAEGAYVINVHAGDFVKTIKVVKRH